MKHIISILTQALLPSNLLSQNDLFKFVQPEINGTARYSSMAGALELWG